MLLIETGMLALALLIAFVYPALGSGSFETLEGRLSALAHRRTLSIILVGVTALALRAVTLPIEPIPEPIVHDEFGYLLAADTFAHGRLTNPTPPMWEHFETFHVMFHPTYASIYPPAQGFFLAIGKAVFGHPFWGVWLSVGLMCAAITWMLQGWLAPEFALLGGLIALMRYAVFGYWADSYWGGAVAAIGGALVLGALPRIKHSQRIGDSIVMGIGLSILANSRPFEGFVLSVPVAMALFAWIFSKKSPRLHVTALRVIAPLALVLALTAAGTGYYLWRVTGSPVRMPYQIERQTYAIAPYMIWQPIRPEPAYHHAVMRKMFVEEEMQGLKACRSAVGLALRAYLSWRFFLGPVLTLPFLALAFTLPRDTSLRTTDRMTLTLLSILGVFIAGSLLVNFYSAHYSAPVTGLVVLLLMLAMRQLRHWGKSGLCLARAVPIICLISLGVRVAAKPLRVPLQEFYEFGWDQLGHPSYGRAAVQRQLGQLPGGQLVIVRYQPDHPPFQEWVYNESGIDDAKIVWARDMGQDRNTELTRYFSTRRVWLLDADVSPRRLSPYLNDEEHTTTEIHPNNPGRGEVP